MTYRLKVLISTVILAPILGGLQGKMFALDLCQRCGTTLYIIEWTVSYLSVKQKIKNLALKLCDLFLSVSNSFWGLGEGYSYKLDNEKHKGLDIL